MLGFYEKRRLKSFLVSKLALIALAVTTALLVTATWDVYQKARETDVRRAQREAELADLVNRETLLRDELARLETRQGLEAEIRDKFDVARAGEGVIVVVDSKEEERNFAAPGKGIWSTLLDFFTRN